MRCRGSETSGSVAGVVSPVLGHSQLQCCCSTCGPTNQLDGPGSAKLQSKTRGQQVVRHRTSTCT
jgi:hypothetical protein